MKIFLDSKDLINIVRYSDPMSAEEARRWFVERGATLVLSYTSVSEFVPVDEHDRLRVRSELNTLESFPLTYARIGDIRCSELRNAVAARSNDAPYATPDIFVSHFWRTFWSEPRDGHDIVLQRQLERTIDLRLWEQVFMLWSRPSNFINAPEHTASIQRILDRHRAAKKRRKERFREELREAVESCDLSPDAVPLLASWINGDPKHCAGWRLYFEVLQAWIRNVTDVAKDGDLNDLTHVFAVPYVDLATLDGRFVEYCRQATAQLAKLDPTVTYAARLFPSFSAIVAEVK